MFFEAGTSIAKIIKCLIDLEAGNADDWATAEIGGQVYDSIQAKKNNNGSYYVEILRKGGDPRVFSGNRIFTAYHLSESTTINLFMEMLKQRDRMPMPSGFRETTNTARRA